MENEMMESSKNNSTNIKYEEIFKLLEGKKDIAIAGHINPDGDSVGSSLALALALLKMGKNPIVLLGNFSSRYNIIPAQEFIYQGNYDDVYCEAFISVDTGDLSRLGQAEKVFDSCNLTINIDHHVSNRGYAKYNFVDQYASSTCEIMYDIISSFTEIDKKIGTCIYNGLLSDSGGFRHSCTSSKTFDIASSLVKIGVDITNVYRETMELRTVSELKAMGKALDNLRVASGTPISYTYLTQDEMDEMGIEYSDLDGIVETILNIRGVGVSILMTDRGNNICKASLRSTGLDVNLIANKFGGGGHSKAAGCCVEGTIQEALKIVINEIKRSLNLKCCK